MITIGFSTRKIDESFLQHIKKSSGIKDVEIIPIENNGIYSLTQAYNMIIERSSNDIVVLCHDDIFFDTNDWGVKLLNHFNTTEYGILGVAGTTHLSNSGRWWENMNNMVGIVNHQSNGKKWKSQYCYDFKSEIIETVLLDGVFLSINKKLIKNIFDEDIKGFHFYDVDFTFSNHINNVKVGVFFDIRITHFSVGQTNNEWELNRIQFVNKHNEFLPYNIKPKIFYKEITSKLKSTPKVSIVILTKNNFELLNNCINSYKNISKYPIYEIIIADTGSDNENLLMIEDLVKSTSNVTLVKYDYYNFAKINNDVVKNHVSNDTELILFSNNDIQILNDVITSMVNTYNNDKNRIGTIGCRLHYDDNTIQHSGMQVSINKNNMIVFTHFGLKSSYVYFDSKKEVFGNTAALLMISKKLFENIGGFNESYKECFEDVELNIECLKRKKINILQSDAVSYHFESKTRNLNPEKNKNMSIDYEKLMIGSVSDNLSIIQKYIYKKVF